MEKGEPVSTSQPLYLQIYTILKKRIFDENYGEGAFLPSERELSEEFQVERATVRRSLKLLSDENLIRKIPGTGSKILFPSPNSSLPKTIDTDWISFVLPGNSVTKISEPFMALLFNDLETECRKLGYSLFYTNATSYENLPALIREHGVKTVIWVSDVERSILDLAYKNKINSIVFGNEYKHFPSIAVDYFGGSQIALRHLIENGHQKIALINGIPNYYTARMRLDGYYTAMLRNKQPIVQDYVVNGDWGFESGYSCMRRLLALSAPPTAVFAANDMMGLGALKAATDLGLSVPEDVSIIGGDNIKQSQYSSPTLTTVGPSIPQLAALLAQYAVASEQNSPAEKGVPPFKIIVPVVLYQRASVRTLSGSGNS
ncbi:GntR family transcriptional regulator [Caproiciproducens sp. NJN-50]|uniref:GntR family transcriptional regulator n=1 Tax=Acutalibacteraceae TaxID=3082771 RepID=UPI000FFDFC6B|nr:MULTISPECIES: GntR family transcriptional regulator [Acutalibacteraceae]QAT49137.1 GntR family transcriptional regulator [Caproiciproducens sp. NJN-50]